MLSRIQIKVPITIVLGLFLVLLISKDFNNPNQRSITGDAEAYYAYLPAIIIYHDLDYNFLSEVNKKYYADNTKDFLIDFQGEKVNKTFPGIALLYLPFFLIAHVLTFLFGAEMDGYSSIYQVCFTIGHFVYLLLGLMAMQKVLLQLSFSKQITNWVLLIIVLGTNMFFYVVFDQSVTHIHNFFLINYCLLNILKHRESGTLKFIYTALFTLALIGITRPTNVLVIGLIIFFIPTVSFYRELLQRLFQLKPFIMVVLSTVPLFLIPFILWKLQTGHWVVYSYGDEGFDFKHPEIFNFLLSYFKGWWLYTPLALIILLLGFGILWKQNKKQFVIGITLFAVLVYVFSSWWCWYYGAGMSQRVMIDYTIVLAYLLGLILMKAQHLGKRSWPLYLVVTLLVFLNVFQAVQIKTGIIQFGSATKAQYWDNFLSLKKVAKIYPPSHWTTLNYKQLNLQDRESIIKGHVYGDAIRVAAYESYSATCQVNFNGVIEGSKLLIRFSAKASTDVELTRMVVFLGNTEPALARTLFLSDYTIKGEWVTMEFLVQDFESFDDAIQFYFWNGDSNEGVEIKDIEVKQYYSDEYF